MIAGIDVSAYQGVVDWPAHAKAGVGFALCKATEGLSFQDSTYGANINAIKAAGLVRGSYHFAHPSNAAQAEAAAYLAYADPGPGHVIALDLETGLETLGGVALRAWADVWMAAVKAARPRNRVLLYCNKAYWLALPGSGCGDGLWIAEYGVSAPTIRDPWLIHQYSDAGGLDRNRSTFPTTAAMKAWAGA